MYNVIWYPALTTTVHSENGHCPCDFNTENPLNNSPIQPQRVCQNSNLYMILNLSQKVQWRTLSLPWGHQKSAPTVINIFTMLVWPINDANINAVRPSPLVALRLGEFSSSSSHTTSLRSLSAAHIKGVMLLYRLSTSTPWRSSLLTWARLPSAAASHSVSAIFIWEGEWSPEEEQTCCVFMM